MKRNFTGILGHHSNKDTAQKALHFGTGQTASSIVIPVVWARSSGDISFSLTSSFAVPSGTDNNKLISGKEVTSSKSGDVACCATESSGGDGSSNNPFCG